ncbi:MAG: hypothetical protein GY835_22945 [bacterium]|nr:hypothetical protein [bacterium]
MRQTKPKPFVFVLMPFAPEYDDVYKLGIKPACESAGAYAERVDEQIFAESILERIYNQISKADLIIADLSERNPNVFYETGYAHCLGKPSILLTRSADDIPFDLKHYHHIVYKGRISDLREELEKRIDWILRNPEKSTEGDTLSAQIFINGQRLLDNPTIIAELSYDPPGRPRKRPERPSLEFMGEEYFSLYLSLDIHNPLESRIRGLRFQLGLVTPRIFETARFENKFLEEVSTNSVLLPEGNSMHLPAVDYSLLPGTWEPIRIDLRGKATIDRDYRLEARLFTESGFQSTPFVVHLSADPETMEEALNGIYF